MSLLYPSVQVDHGDWAAEAVTTKGGLSRSDANVRVRQITAVVDLLAVEGARPSRFGKSRKVGSGEWAHRDFFPPGPQLALVLSESAETIPSDAELLTAARAARRQMAWAAARQLAMLAALSDRRHAEATNREDIPSYRMLNVTESLIEEISVGLGVTSNAATTLLNMADRLSHDLPTMRHLLEAGQISIDHVRILCDALVGLPTDLIPVLEAAVAPEAPDLTTGQFRHRIKTVLHALDPDSYNERVKATSERHRRLEKWDNPTGTTDLALCDLPADRAHAIYNKITAVAQAMRTDGDTRTLDQLRADLATAPALADDAVLALGGSASAIPALGYRAHVVNDLANGASRVPGGPDDTAADVAGAPGVLVMPSLTLRVDGSPARGQFSAWLG